MKMFSASTLIIAALAAGAAFAQTPKVAPRPQPSAPGAVGDSGITNRVRLAIASDPLLQDLIFNVETTDAVVTLTGAGTREQVGRAVSLARSVEGVKSVTNLLAMKGS